MIGVNAMLYRQPAGGVEQAIHGAVAGLMSTAKAKEDFRFFVTPQLGEYLPKLGSVEIHRTGSRLGRILNEHALVWRNPKLRLWHHLGYIAPALQYRKYVVSVYDIIALTHPHLCTRANRLFYNIMLPNTLQKAEVIIVPSEYVRRTICERGFASPDRIRVLPLPLPERVVARRVFSSLKMPMPGRNRFPLLFVGRIEPKKNLPFLLRMLLALPHDLRSVCRLEVYGSSSPFAKKEASRMIQQFNLQTLVHLNDYVSDDQIVQIYQESFVLLYPSLEEGYGYPPLESMSLGTPAIVSDRGALPEVAGRHGAIVAPLVPEAWAHELEKLIRDRSHYRAQAAQGLDRSLAESWFDYGMKIREIYDGL